MEDPEKVARRSTISEHYSSKSMKSIKRKDYDEMVRPKLAAAVDYLVTINDGYMQERKKLREQKAKPYDTKLNLPQAGLLSTYRDHFHSKTPDLDRKLKLETQNTKQSFSYADKKVSADSTYRRHHQGAKSELPPIATWDEGFRLKGPLSSLATYKVRYPSNVVELPRSRTILKDGACFELAENSHWLTLYRK